MPCFFVFWLDSKPVAEVDSEVDFLIRNSFLRLAFLLCVDGLFLLLVGRVSLPSLVSREKVKVEPTVIANLNSLP